jgi:hypothetical protein
LPKVKKVKVAELSLDLKNYRTVPQPNEVEATKAMIAVSPSYFWGLADSLLRDGYLPTENIVVLRIEQPPEMRVKEGNRRIAILKLAFGLIDWDQVGIPDAIRDQLISLDAKWKRNNRTVPCTVFEPAEADAADRVVTLAHGKGEKAGRDAWNAVARARHNRDINGAQEPALDLLETYLVRA